MKKSLLVMVLFIGVVFTLVKDGGAQTPLDSLLGVSQNGYAYIRQDLVNQFIDGDIKTIEIGGSVTKGWKLNQAKLYWDMSNPNSPGYYILKLGKKMKLGATVIIYMKLSNDIWLPQAVIEGGYDIFPEDIIVLNDKKDGHNFKFKVNDYMVFDFESGP